MKDKSARLPLVSVRAMYSAISPAGSLGARHGRQKISPGFKDRFLLDRRDWRKAASVSPLKIAGRKPSMACNPCLCQFRIVLRWQPEKAAPLRQPCRSDAFWRAGNSGAASSSSGTLTPCPRSTSEARLCALAPMRPNLPAHRSACGPPCDRSVRRRQRRAWRAIVASTAGPKCRERVGRLCRGEGRQGKLASIFLQLPHPAACWRRWKKRTEKAFANTRQLLTCQLLSRSVMRPLWNCPLMHEQSCGCSEGKPFFFEPFHNLRVALLDHGSGRRRRRRRRRRPAGRAHSRGDHFRGGPKFENLRPANPHGQKSRRLFHKCADGVSGPIELIVIVQVNPFGVPNGSAGAVAFSNALRDKLSGFQFAPKLAPCSAPTITGVPSSASLNVDRRKAPSKGKSIGFSRV